MLAAGLIGILCSFVVVDRASADHINRGALGTTYVDGASGQQDDWGDHFNEIGLICNGCARSNNTDLVVMWQAILRAEKLLGDNEIDGVFGPRTERATKAWQTRFGLDADGLVGDLTWGAADGRLFWTSSTSNVLAYRARVDSNSTVTFRRGNRDFDPYDGAYQLLQANGTDGAGQVRFTSSTHRVFFSTRTISVDVCPC